MTSLYTLIYIGITWYVDSCYDFERLLSKTKAYFYSPDQTHVEPFNLYFYFVKHVLL
jgi:hypothetical protein